MGMSDPIPIDIYKDMTKAQLIEANKNLAQQIGRSKRDVISATKECDYWSDEASKNSQLCSQLQRRVLFYEKILNKLIAGEKTISE